MKLAIVAMMLGCMVGCTSVTAIRTPNGNKGFSIMCRDSIATNQTDCYRLAGESCSGGYRVLDNEGMDRVYVNQYGGGTIHSTILTIECK